MVWRGDEKRVGREQDWTGAEYTVVEAETIGVTGTLMRCELVLAIFVFWVLSWFGIEPPNADIWPQGVGRSSAGIRWDMMGCRAVLGCVALLRMC